MSQRLQLNAREWGVTDGTGPNEAGEGLRSARKSVGMDLNAAAKAIGISVVVLQRIEVGALVLRRPHDYLEMARRIGMWARVAGKGKAA